MEQKDKKYIVITSKMMANGLMFITGQKPKEYENNLDPNKHVYSFINDDSFKEAFIEIQKLKEKLCPKYDKERIVK